MSVNLRNLTLQAMAIHTERIHDDQVWDRLQSLLSLISRRKSRATFFVYTFRAIVAGREEVAFERVKKLREEGHEIGQHTHFYVGRAVDKPNKVADLSNGNVLYCLQRDYQWLEQIVPPQGFTSGGWAVPEVLYPILAELAFNYDCSARSPRLRIKGSVHALYLEHPEVRKFREHSLLLLPTTHTLKEMFPLPRWANLPAAPQGIRYRLVYFHDYDLLRWEVYAAVWWILRFSSVWMTCGQVAEAVLNFGDRLKSVEEKYSRLAWQFSEKSYVNVKEFMNHRLELVLRWGCPLQPGDRILELGCGDGYLGCLLARHGLRYTGTDIAPGMIEAAQQRAQAQGVEAEFFIMDMNHPIVDGEFEAIISFARTFFVYTHEPLKLLRWMRVHTLKKVIVDWNHLCPMSLHAAAQIVQEAGFMRVGFRPFLVPMKRRIPQIAQRLLYDLEAFPPLGLLLTRRKFFVLIKGEVDSSQVTPANSNAPKAR